MIEKVRNIAKKHGIPFTTGHVETGIIATIKGKNPDTKEILLRADLDALPIKEDNIIDYKSKNDGEIGRASCRERV